MKINIKGKKEQMSDFKYTVVCTIKNKDEAEGFLLGDNQEHLVDSANYDYVNYVDMDTMKQYVRDGLVSSFAYNKETDEIEVEYGTKRASIAEFLKSDFTIDRGLYNTILNGCIVGTVMMVLKPPYIGNCMYVKVFGDMGKVKALVNIWSSNKKLKVVADQCHVYENNASLVIPIMLFKEMIDDVDFVVDLGIRNRSKSEFSPKMNRVHRKMEVTGKALTTALEPVERNNRRVLAQYGVFDY
jgi:hypothetical protein